MASAACCNGSVSSAVLAHYYWGDMGRKIVAQTHDEPWEAFQPGELLVARGGEIMSVLRAQTKEHIGSPDQGVWR